MKNYDKSIDYFYKLTKSEHFAEYATMNYKTVKSVYATLQKLCPMMNEWNLSLHK